MDPIDASWPPDCPIRIRSEFSMDRAFSVLVLALYLSLGLMATSNRRSYGTPLKQRQTGGKRDSKKDRKRTGRGQGEDRKRTGRGQGEGRERTGRGQGEDRKRKERNQRSIYIRSLLGLLRVPQGGVWSVFSFVCPGNRGGFSREETNSSPRLERYRLSESLIL